MAAHEPCVDLFLDGDPPKKWNSQARRAWPKSSNEREHLFGDNPADWMDPFASPLFWFTSPGFALSFVGSNGRPQQAGGSGRYDYGASANTDRHLVKESRTLRRFPPEGFAPGAGWTVQGRGLYPTASPPAKEGTRMFVSLGESLVEPKMVDARAEFCRLSGAAVGKHDDMGRWLAAVLSGSGGGREFETAMEGRSARATAARPNCAAVPTKYFMRAYAQRTAGRLGGVCTCWELAACSEGGDVGGGGDCGEDGEEGGEGLASHIGQGGGRCAACASYEEAVLRTLLPGI